jgi:glycosyltransferase involved in cell wall biosynthesis
MSVIIPCKNEDKNIARCIEALLKQDLNNMLEIIVVDNGSTDNTIKILNCYIPRIKLLHFTGSPISQVRNYGARIATRDWLAFIDGDVEVDEYWYDSFCRLINKLEKENVDLTSILTGSTCIIPNISTWVEQHWFYQLFSRDKKTSKYINSGNLIVNRKLFYTIGGFDPKHPTGEDEKFCDEARKHGGIVLKDASIKAIHHGYPKTLIQFYRRERWHGIGMKNYLKNPLKYRDLLIAFYNWGIILTLGVLLFLGLLNINLIVIMAILSLLPMILFGLLRGEGKVQRILALLIIYSFYEIAKTFAIIDIFLKKNHVKKDS